ncbi:MAG: WbqC family protein [Candidatus Lokiarchaeota archaeon]|nr:WbqC family protein [Candidatus Lokiarchaeota archaeon]
MKIAIMQPYFFPYIGYFQLINAVDKYILYDHFNYIKSSWINRNRIIQKKSEIGLITLPLKNKSSFLKIKDIEIDDTKKWKEKTIKTIKINYSKAPYFDIIYPIVKDVIELQTDKLSNINKASIKNICNYLQIKTTIDYNYNNAGNIENLLFNDNYLESNYSGLEKKTARLIEICKIEKADTYLNSIGGIDLYSKDIFNKHNIQLRFLKTNIIKYKQFTNTFIPNLSIIDVLMFNSPDEIHEMLDDYELI